MSGPWRRDVIKVDIPSLSTLFNTLTISRIHSHSTSSLHRLIATTLLRPARRPNFATRTLAAEKRLM